MDREHPQGSLPYKLQFPFAEGAKGGKEDFQAPAGKSAKDKIFFHAISISQEKQIYVPEMQKRIDESPKKH